MWGRLLWDKILESKIGGIVMAWVAVDKNGSECIFEKKPFRLRKQWMIPISFKNAEYCGFSDLPKGSIKKLIGRELSWNDEPVELK